MLFAEAALALSGWDVARWDAIYEDRPSAQLKLRVRDRGAVRVCADETRVLEPAPLQATIDALAAREQGGRAFLRPSGTEDIVRVYAEAADAAAAQRLAEGVIAAAKEALA